MSKPKLLIISSEKDVQIRCEEVLTPNYDLLIAKNGKEGKRLLEENLLTIQVIVLDAALADTIAQNWIAEVKKDHILPYIILIAPETVPEWMIESMKEGAMDIVAKRPYYDSELVLAIKQAFEYTQITKYLIRSAEEAKSKAIQKRFSTFLTLFLNRRKEGRALTPSEIAVFFPTNSEAKDIPLEKIIEIVSNNQSQSIVKQWGEKPTLLIVEDQIKLRKTLKNEFIKECTVITASSSEEALALCKTQDNIDVALLDIGLPQLSGDDLLPLLKEKYPNIQIAMLTAYSEYRLIVKTVNSGAGDYIVKPYDRENLKYRIFTLLQSKTLQRTLEQYMGIQTQH